MKQWSNPEIKNLALTSTNDECLRTSGASAYSRRVNPFDGLSYEEVLELKRLGWDVVCGVCDKFDLNHALVNICKCLGNPNVEPTCSA